MSWTTPRTWTDGELVTAAIMNPHVRDNLSFLKEGVGRTTADITVTSSTAYVDATGLSFSIGANEVYAIHIGATWQISGGGDLKTVFTVPSGATGHQWGNYATVEGSRVAIGSDLIFGAGSTADYAGAHWATVVNSTNAGTVQFRFAQFTSDGTATILRQNAYLVATRIA